jgi:hypothetical protein
MGGKSASRGVKSASMDPIEKRFLSHQKSKHYPGLVLPMNILSRENINSVLHDKNYKL